MSPYAPSDARLIEHLISIADASRRDDGTDIPLGEMCRRAAQRLRELSVPDTTERPTFALALGPSGSSIEIVRDGVVMTCNDILAALRGEAP